MQPYGVRSTDASMLKYPSHQDLIRIASDKIRAWKRPAKKHARQEGKNIINRSDLNG